MKCGLAAKMESLSEKAQGKNLNIRFKNIENKIISKG